MIDSSRIRVSLLKEEVWGPLCLHGRESGYLSNSFIMTGLRRETFGQGSFLESTNDPPKTTELTQEVNSDGADDVTNSL